MGTRATLTSGEKRRASETRPPPMASGPVVGATPPSTPTAFTRSGMVAPAARA